jgi:NAD(P)-dependent dehydrogenase (short-subunit alcohol dehydrogenase family)
MISVRCELLCGSSLDRGRWGACGECFLLWTVSYHLDPAYGATKAGLDKLRFDMAQDFKLYNVAVSIWPGPTATERSKSVIAKIPGATKYSKAKRHLSFLVSLSLRCIRIRN